LAKIAEIRHHNIDPQMTDRVKQALLQRIKAEAEVKRVRAETEVKTQRVINWSIANQGKQTIIIL
jgi:hypothetical protein